MGRAWRRGELAESHARGDEWRAPGRGILSSVHNGGWWTSVPRSTMGPQSPFSKRTFMRISHVWQDALHIRNAVLSEFPGLRFLATGTDTATEIRRAHAYPRGERAPPHRTLPAGKFRTAERWAS